VVSCNDCGGIVSVDGNPPGSERAEEEYARIGERILAGAGAGGAASSCGATYAGSSGSPWVPLVALAVLVVAFVVLRLWRRARQ